MPKKKQMPKKKIVKTKTINRYNVFQKELAEYIKETGGKKSDFKKYKSLYKEIDKTVPAKSFQDVINALVKKKGGVEEKLNYAQNFPFYTAVAEFSLPMYDNVKLRIKFDDGAEKVDWSGSSLDFAVWFKGGVTAYLRNNYSESGNMATFVLKKADKKSAEYEIETMSSAVGTKGYIPSGSESLHKSTLPKSEGKVSSAEESLLKQREMTAAAETLKMKTELELIRELKKLGFSNKEIKKRLGG